MINYIISFYAGARGYLHSSLSILGKANWNKLTSHVLTSELASDSPHLECQLLLHLLYKNTREEVKIYSL